MGEEAHDLSVWVRTNHSWGRRKTRVCPSVFTTDFDIDMNVARKKRSRSAGLGDPYWYEWGIGLLKAVEMLNPDSDIEAVAFQKDGIKGWDDVVVRYRSGHQDYYQVKHSRPRTNLTFSDLVSKSDNKPSLLGALTSSWHDMNLSATDSSCILITNRSAGTRPGKSKSGTYQPPLAAFISHISAEVRGATLLGDVAVRQEWEEAWGVWKSEMGPMSDDEKLQFLRALTISTEAPQLEDMRDRLTALFASSVVNHKTVSKCFVEDILVELSFKFKFWSRVKFISQLI